jgi:hypothetical protein
MILDTDSEEEFLGAVTPTITEIENNSIYCGYSKRQETKPKTRYRKGSRNYKILLMGLLFPN